jgi:hypothetical protein
MSTFEVVRGAEGDCLLLHDTRICGPKPWGGGAVTKTFHTDKAYAVVPKDEFDRLKGENAELVRVLHEVEREAVHAYRCLQHDCEQVLESEQHFFKKWWSSDCENAKLRELVRDMWGWELHGCGACNLTEAADCDTDIYSSDCLMRKMLTDRMRELGIEAEQ